MENTFLLEDFEREATKEQVFLQEAQTELENQFIPIQYGSVEIDFESLICY